MVKRGKRMMPAYEYKCKDCGITITIVRGIKDEEHKPVCISCKAVMPRVYESAPAVTFLGIGWGKDA
jgi:putative FmdB family regulatory protein